MFLTFFRFRSSSAFISSRDIGLRLHLPLYRMYWTPPEKTISLFMGIPFTATAAASVVYRWYGVVKSLALASSTVWQAESVPGSAAPDILAGISAEIGRASCRERVYISDHGA